MTKSCSATNRSRSSGISSLPIPALMAISHPLAARKNNSFRPSEITSLALTESLGSWVIHHRKTRVSSSTLSARRLPNLLRKRCVEVLANHHPTRRAARLAPLRLFPRWDEPSHRPAGPGYDDLLPLTHSIQQPRQVRLGLVNVHHSGHQPRSRFSRTCRRS